MKRLSVFLFVLTALLRPCFAQSLGPATNVAKPAPPSVRVKSKSARGPTTTAELQAALDQLTRSNHDLAQSNADLLDLLKKQQSVLEDIQFDRRLQSRQIESLEERLEETHLENEQLENKIANLETADAVARSPEAATPPRLSMETDGASSSLPRDTVEEPPPPPPSTYLPPPETEGMPGTKSWHRLFTLKGDDSRNTDLFHVEGRTWRVLWHNLDKPGKSYENTSALFINAFPKDDTIPQKVCSKLGSGGSSTELDGPGNYYLKIEASGGSWELAVEDFR